MSLGLAAGLFAITHVAAADAAPPDLDMWMMAPRAAQGAYPRRLTLVAALPPKISEPVDFVEFDFPELARVSAFEAADGASAEWDIKLNLAKFHGRDTLTVVYELTEADTVVVAPPGGEWQILTLAPSGGGKVARQVQATAKGPAAASTASIAAWLLQTLGWDGVVLAERDGFLLVGSTAQRLATPAIQALAVGDSADKFTLREAERQGAGLLALSASRGGIGLFDVVFLGQGVSTLPVGTKLIIERRAPAPGVP